MRTFIIIGTIFSFSFLYGCAKRVGEPKKVELNYVFWGDVTELAMNKHWIRQFEKKHPHIKVNMVHTAGGIQTNVKILNMIAGNVPPDVMYVWPEIFPEFVQRNIYLPLDTLMARDNLNKNLWFPHLLKPYTYKGKLYGLPRSWHPYVIFYNKNIFDTEGVPYPDETWDLHKLIKYGKQLTKDKDGDGRIDQFAIGGIRWQTFVWAQGGETFDAKGNCYLTEPEAIKGLKIYRDLIWKYKISPSPQQEMQVQSTQDMFATGRLAMYALGIWCVPRFRTIRRFQWDIAPMPKLGKKKVTMLVTAGWAIYNKTRHKNEAWELVKYLSGPEAQSYQMKIWRDPSGLKEVFRKLVFYQPEKPPEHRQVILESIKFGRFETVFPKFNQTYDIVNRELEKITYNLEPSIKKVCQKIQKESQKLR